MVLSMDRWVGKVAVVTGASAGIGAAIAQRLVEGLVVAALARRKDRLDDLAKQLAGAKGKLHPIATDLTKEEDILNAFKWIRDNLGPVHILINNAGLFNRTLIASGDTSDWRNTFDVNVLGLCIAAREAIKDMRTNNVDGHLVNINSILGHSIDNRTGVGAYAASKFAGRAISETLRLELNALKSKIKVTNLSPGLIRSELNPPTLDIPKLLEEGRIVEPQEIADGVVYALSTPPHVQIQELIIRPILDPVIKV